MSLKQSILQSPMKTSLLLWLSFLFYYYWACLCLSIPLVSGHSVPCLEDQKLLLLQLKEDLKFDPSYYRKLLFWNESSPCSEWRGVSWDEEGHVAGLDLSYESIYGGLDDYSPLFSLQYLEHLNLAFNNISSVIPSRIKYLKSLTSLNLSHAGFLGQIPMEIAQLTRLAILDLSQAAAADDDDLSSLYYKTYYLAESDMKLAGPEENKKALKLENPNLMKLVQNLSEVRELYLDNIDISLKGNEWGPALSSSMPHLQVLSMSNCNLSGPINSSLEILQNLSIIHLDYNNLLTGPVPDFFAKFSNLTQLHLGNCNLSGRFPNEILQVQSLTSLDLTLNGGLQGSLPDFPHNASLQALVLRYTSFSGALPDSIGSLQKLSILDLYNCQFIGTLPESMSNLTELVILNLSYNFFTGPIPTFVKAKSLTLIDLSKNKLSGGISSEHFTGLVKLGRIDLWNNFLNGSVPMSLFSLPSLQHIELSYNCFQGQLDAISNVSSSSMLQSLDLSNNYLEGPIPQFIFHLEGLEYLWLSSNKFNGTIRLDMFERLQNLTTLYLSNNNLSIDASVKSADHSPSPKVINLGLGSCNLRRFPGFLRSMSTLKQLDLSNNEIKGKIPNWIWELKDLYHLNLSHNLLQQRERISYSFSSYFKLDMLDLHDNDLQGALPAFPPSASYLDFSNNKFSSVIYPNIGKFLSHTIFLSLSHNALNERIPVSICNSTKLQVLDLSYNNFSGGIPYCLVKSNTLGVLNLGKNNLSGKFPNTFQASCALKTLDISSNNLHGPIPKSLSNCTMLEVLDIGNNKINDGFPCLLKAIPTLRVMVLRGNNFHGPIGCPNMKMIIWKMLQIVDLSLNNFNGTLPGELFRTWKAMILDKNQTSLEANHKGFIFNDFDGGVNYQDRVIVTIKGHDMNLTKILTIFTSIDFSSNQIEGSIPEEMMDFTALLGLNLSNNNLSGPIPSSIGKLKQLESLDLSENSFTGRILQELASLSFLSFMNFSYNHLKGRIPTGTQLQSFEASSFQGNDLYGPPLTPISCKCPNPTPTLSGNNQANDFGFIMGLESGVVFGLGVIIGPLFFWKQWRISHWKCVDFILCSIFPQIYVDYQRREGQWINVLRWRH